MHPEQIKAAILELMAEITTSKQPANEVINFYTRSRRYIGSKDRRSLTDTIWSLIRYQARLSYLLPQADISEKIDYLKTNPTWDIPPMPDDVRYEIPAWLLPYFNNRLNELSALLEPAPIVLRANGPRDKIQHLLLDEGIETIPTPRAPLGLILTKRVNLAGSAAFKNGLIEIQDEGSQLLAESVGVTPGDWVLDYCAGAGGKSLYFAQQMHKRGHITAYDISVHRLTPLIERSTRAGVQSMITIAEKEQTHNWQNRFDHVVVDAPCSGTGTWRRCPDARWKLTPQKLSDLQTTQRQILKKTTAFVKQNGILSYMTCSLLSPENEEQVTWFLAENPDFNLLETKHFTPATTHTDGFFIARFQKRGKLN